MGCPLVSRLLAVNIPSISVMSTRPLVILYIKVALLTVTYNARFPIARFRCNGFARHHFATVRVLAGGRIKRFRLSHEAES